MTVFAFVVTFSFSFVLVKWILEEAFVSDNSTSEYKAAHPLLTALTLFAVWAATVLSNIVTLKFFYNADGKMRAYDKPVSSENFALQVLKFVVTTLMYTVLLLGTRRVIFSIANEMLYSTTSGQYYLPNPAEHFWQALLAFYCYLIPTTLCVHCIYGIAQKEGVIPYSLKFFNSMMVLFGYLCFIGWSLSCIVVTLPSYNAIPMIYLVISLISLSQWFGESTAFNLTAYQWFISFMGFLKQLMIFLTRLSQVVLVFLPLDGFGAVQKHLIYLVLLFLFGNNDLFGNLFRCGTCCNRDPPTQQQRTWAQFFCSGFLQIIHLILTVYRTVWVFILVVPGLHTAAMQFSPGRLSLQIFSIWNLLAFVADMLHQRSVRLATEQERDAKESVESGYMPLSGGDSMVSSFSQDVEMCAPTAVITAQDEKKQVVGNTISSVNLF
eukprot:gene23666-32039_t